MFEMLFHFFRSVQVNLFFTVSCDKGVNRAKRAVPLVKPLVYHGEDSPIEHRLRDEHLFSAPFIGERPPEAVLDLFDGGAASVKCYRVRKPRGDGPRRADLDAGAAIPAITLTPAVGPERLRVERHQITGADHHATFIRLTLATVAEAHIHVYSHKRSRHGIYCASF